MQFAGKNASCEFLDYVKNSMQAEMLLANFLIICEKHVGCNAVNNTHSYTFVHILSKSLGI